MFSVSFVPWLGFLGGAIVLFHGIILREVNWAWAGISLCFYGFFSFCSGVFFCFSLADITITTTTVVISFS